MNKVFFYVGANNTTGELEIEKIEALVAAHFNEFTAYEVIGYWRRKKERSLKIEVITDESAPAIARIAKELKEKLNQEAVGFEVVKTNFALV